MRFAQFETVSGSQVTIFFTDKVTVHQYYRNRDGGDAVCVMDGLHNNGGWEVKGTYQEVVDKIMYANEMGVK
jgi:hypothetical protein